jgi:hypothetical protein
MFFLYFGKIWLLDLDPPCEPNFEFLRKCFQADVDGSKSATKLDLGHKKSKSQQKNWGFLDFQFLLLWKKILDKYLKAHFLHFWHVEKSDFFIKDKSEILQGVFLGAKEALYKISDLSSTQISRSGLLQIAIFGLFQKWLKFFHTVENRKSQNTQDFCCDFDFLWPKSSSVADFDPI